MVVQKVQQLSEFFSDNDGWPLKSKLLSCFIKLKLNDTIFLLTSAYFSGIFLPKLQNNDLMTSSWRHNVVTNSDFYQTFQYDLSYRYLSFVKVSSHLDHPNWTFYTRLNFQDIRKFKQSVPTDPPTRNRVEPFPIGIIVCARYIIIPRIFWRVFLLRFKFLMTFFTDFVILFVLNSCFQNVTF